MTDPVTGNADAVEPRPAVQRRTMLRGVAAGGVVVAGGALLAACGSDDSTSSAGSVGETSPTPTTSKSGGQGGDQDVIVATSDVPDGGGVIVAEQGVVVTQPTKGEFAAFSSICTHQGCEVGDVSAGTINCPCHGSQFSIEDGSVVTGPATVPLPPVEITVDGDSVVRA